jgi:hypothetical protein
LWHGDLYPRWLFDMNYGLGSPTFFIYPPFPSFIYALLLPMGRAIPMDTFSLGECLCLLTSGMCAFLWMRTIVGRWASMFASLIYLLLPYHLAIDFYRRGALSECWALAWMPLVLYFVTQVVRKKRYGTIGLALSFALLILCHLVSVFMLSAVPFLVAFTIGARGQKTRALFTVLGALVLGAAVSGSYLAPALANAKYFPVYRLEIPINDGPQGNLLLYGPRLFTRHSEKSGFIQSVSLATVDTALFLAFCGLTAFRDVVPRRRRQRLLWLATCPIPLFLMHESSSAVWAAFPILGSAVQFPWRFDVVLCIAALPLAAFMLEDMMELPMRLRACVLLVTVLFAVTFLAGYVETARRMTREQRVAVPIDNKNKRSVHDGWFAAWTPRGMDQDSALEASRGPAARLLSGDGVVTVLVWKPRHIEVLTDCSVCGPLEIKQLYYPKWEAQVLPSGRPLQVRPALPEGLVEVQTPPGFQRIRIDMPIGRDERIGNWLSGAGSLFLGLMTVYRVVRDRVQPSGAGS